MLFRFGSDVPLIINKIRALFTPASKSSLTVEKLYKKVVLTKWLCGIQYSRYIYIVYGIFSFNISLSKQVLSVSMRSRVSSESKINLCAKCNNVVFKENPKHTFTFINHL